MAHLRLIRAEVNKLLEAAWALVHCPWGSASEYETDHFQLLVQTAMRSDRLPSS